MREYNLDKYIDDIYSLIHESNNIYDVETSKDKDTKRYRTKTIRSGNMLEQEIYPIWSTSKKAVKDRVKNRSKEMQDRVNRKNLRKKLIRLSNANFGSNDIWITVGYRNKASPSSVIDAKRDVVNYIRRLQRYVKKKGWKKLKYLYVTEGNGEDTRFHHHIILSFPDRDIAESKWTKGEYPQARRLQPNDYGLEGLARYITKSASTTTKHEDGECHKYKNYGYSLNLVKSWLAPYMTVADWKISKRKANQLARYEMDAAEYFQKLNPQYQYTDMRVHTSDYVAGWYIYVRMRKRDG